MNENNYQVQPQPIFNITLATHNFTITRINNRVKDLIFGFGKQNVQYGMVRLPHGKYVKAAVKVFGAATMDRSEFRFHINQYKDFIEYMAMHNYKEDLMSISVKELLPGKDIDIKMKVEWVPKDYQVPVIQYIEDFNNVVSKFVELQTGQGKSMCGTYALVNNGKRVVVIVKAGYIDKWVSDFLKMTDVKKKEIVTIQGSTQLKQLIQLGVEDKVTFPFIVIGNRTFQNYLKEYEEFKHEILAMGYGCLPEDFFETVGAGARLIDEVHQDFHLNYKIDMYTNVPKSVSLSATLLNNDPFLERMYKIAYPLTDRYSGQPLKRYAHAKAVIYSMQTKRYFNTTERDSPTYSHNAFERSILKSHDFTKSYFSLILNTIKASYILNYKKGQRMIVFFASLDMVDSFVKCLKSIYSQFDIRKFIGGDDLKDLLEADITISTLQNAGTAHDIPNLTTVILTPSVQSIQANIQVLGRLREITDTRVEFIYLACRDIPKQMDYHLQKTTLLEQRAATLRICNASELV